MTKREIESSLLEFNKGAITINITQIARSRGKARKWAREIMKDTPPLENGHSKEYLIKDVAAVMYERSENKAGIYT